MTGVTGAARTADTVHIVFGDVGEFVVDDVGEPLDVEASCRNVGCDQNAHGVILKARKCFGARRLAFVTMNGGSDDAVFFKLLRQAVGGVLHAREDEHLFPLIVNDEIPKQFTLALFRNRIGFLLDDGRFLVAGNFDVDRILQERVGELADFVAEGGGKKKRLTLFRDEL